ncbi:MAG: GNAT family N-acetyltransferase [Anaerolineales bacterium]|nr:GNAT family N-acetyltransferase [Anaerolineales bacterium]
MENLIITPTTVIDFKPANSEDLPLVMAILTDASAWLQAKAIDQWPSPLPEHWHQRMVDKIAHGEIYTVGIVKNRFGIVGLNWADPYWPDDGRAGYVHRMAIRSSMHGQNWGSLILFWAQQQVKKRGRPFLRLDCAAGNGRLRGYYEAQKFICQGTVTDHDYVAALYEKPI